MILHEANVKLASELSSTLPNLRRIVFGDHKKIMDSTLSNTRFLPCLTCGHLKKFTIVKGK